MNLVTSEIVADLSGLSPSILIAATVAGATLWLLGWWSHRFWVVLLATIGAGILGLFEAPAQRAQPLIASLLLALAAGLLALALVRLLAFLGGGVVGVATAHSFAPNFDQPLVLFLCCGLVSLLLFRWCMMALTSFAGASILMHGCLAFLQQRGTMDVADWLDKNPLAPWALGLLTLVGFLVQLGFDRRRRRKVGEEEAEKPEKKKKKLRDEDGFVLWGTKKAG